MKTSRTGIERAAYIKKLNSMNEFDRLVENLSSGELSLTHIELAYATYVKRAEHIPEGIKNLLVPTGDDQRGALTHCFKMLKATIGACELAYRRGKVDKS